MRLFDPGEPDRLKELRAREITTRGGPAVAVLGGDRPALRGRCPSLWRVAPAQGSGPSQGSLVLMADRTGRGPVSDSGPFRVQITCSHPVFDRDFTARSRSARPRGEAAGRRRA